MAGSKRRARPSAARAAGEVDAISRSAPLRARARRPPPARAPPPAPGPTSIRRPRRCGRPARCGAAARARARPGTRRAPPRARAAATPVRASSSMRSSTTSRPASTRPATAVVELRELDAAARRRCAIRTGSSASAARNAALSAMLRMLPPATSSRASLRSVEPLARRARREDAAPDLARAARRPGYGNCTTKRSRRRKAASSARLHVGREDREAAVGLHPLQQVADLDVRVAVVAVLDLAALAEERVGLVEEQDGAAAPRRRRTRGAGSSRSRRCTCSRRPTRSMR